MKKKIIGTILLIIGLYFFVDEALLALTVFETGGIPLLIDHFMLGVFWKRQVVGLVFPVVGVILWVKSLSNNRGEENGRSSRFNR